MCASIQVGSYQKSIKMINRFDAIPQYIQYLSMTSGPLFQAVSAIVYN